ncbi:DUF6300 family protein, partial [Streptomyces sp. NPDC006476]|uniref:DUF6300 family protein n=1 Tax=Streptomyces sp. NPDC006476 TaxID=3157175 RepID=UPI0033AEEDAE
MPPSWQMPVNPVTVARQREPGDGLGRSARGRETGHAVRRWPLDVGRASGRSWPFASRSTPEGGLLMSFTWRYLVRPDGSFSRFGNVDGGLDNVSDDELARQRPAPGPDDEETTRPCSRCGGDLLLHWHGPLSTGVWMELCPACDAHRPAARAFIRWHVPALSGLLPPFPASPGSGCPQLQPLLRQRVGAGLPPPLEPSEVDPERGTGLTTSPFLRVASRTRRAPLSAPG